MGDARGPPLEVAVLIGIPGAGKSTFVKERLARTHSVVSKDLMPRSARDKGGRQLREVEAALRAGRSVVVDNTNPGAADRSLILALARAYGARPVAYWFPVDVKASLARNARRVGRARVPDVAVFSILRRMEAPRLEEGFASVFRVRPREGGRFLVDPVKPSPSPAGVRRRGGPVGAGPAAADRRAP